MALPPCVLLQTQHQRGGARSSGWQVKQVGGLFGAGAAPALVMEAAAAMEAGEAVAMDFGPQKTGGNEQRLA